MNYFLKIKYLPENPCFDPISNSPPSELFEKSKSDPPFGTRNLSHYLEADVDPTLIDSKYETVFRKEYQQLCERYDSYFEAYINGSKCEHKVAAATFYPKDLITQEMFAYNTAILILMPNLWVYS